MKISNKHLLLLKNNPSVRQAWLGMLISRLGDGIYTVGLVWLTYQISKSGAALGLVLGANAVATFLFGFLAGIISDHMDKRKLMFISSLVCGGIVLLSYLLLELNLLTIPLIIILSFSLGAATQFFEPTLYSLIPRLVRDKDLANTNATIGFTDSIGYLIGPLLGGVIISVTSINTVVLLNAISYFIAAIFIITIRTYKNKVEEKTQKPTLAGFFGQVGKGIMLVTRQVRIRNLLGITSLAMLAYSPLFVILPIYLDKVLELSVSDQTTMLGSIYSALALGQLVGYALVPYLPTDLRKLIFYGYLLHAVGFGSLAYVNNNILITFFIFLGGLSFGFAGAAFITALQKNTPQSYVGTVFGLKSALEGLVVPLGRSLTGFSVGFVGSKYMFVIMAFLFVLAGLWANIGLQEKTVQYESDAS